MMFDVCPRDVKFEDYKDKYENVKMARDDNGILTMTFHTKGESLVWDPVAHDELAQCFAAVGADWGNKVIIMTGAGDSWCNEIDFPSFDLSTPRQWERQLYYGRKLLTNLMDINVPVIAAVNGPARFHPEIPVMADVVIASENALFQDGPHFPSGIVPGDGAHTVWTYVLGLNRGRYFLITGQELDAQKAMEYGAVSEVVPTNKLMARAYEVANKIAANSDLTCRHTRLCLTKRFRQALHNELDEGLALETTACIQMLADIKK